MKCYAPEPSLVPESYLFVPHYCTACEHEWEDDQYTIECPECGDIREEDTGDE